MQKIIYISHYLDIGGVETTIKYLLKNFEAKDKKLLVFCIGGYNESFICSSNNLYKLKTPSDFIFLYKTLSKTDVIVSSLWKSHLLSLCLKLLKFNKNITFIHNNKYKHFLDRFLSFLSMIVSYKIFTDSKASYDFVINQFPNFKQKAHVINFKFKREKLIKENTKSKLENFLYVGRFVKQKNITYLLELFDLLSKTNKNIKLDLYGIGKLNDYQNKILKLNKQINYCGKLKPEDVELIMQKYDAFIQTSINEGMCITLTQALYMKLICFATPVGEISSYLKDFENGYYLDGFDINKDLSKIKNQLNNSKNLQVISNNLDKFDIPGESFEKSFIKNI